MKKQNLMSRSFIHFPHLAAVLCLGISQPSWAGPEESEIPDFTQQGIGTSSANVDVDLLLKTRAVYGNEPVAQTSHQFYSDGRAMLRLSAQMPEYQWISLLVKLNVDRGLKMSGTDLDSNWNNDAIEKFGIKLYFGTNNDIVAYIGQGEAPIGLDILENDGDAPGVSPNDRALNASKASTFKRAMGVFVKIPAQAVLESILSGATLELAAFDTNEDGVKVGSMRGYSARLNAQIWDKLLATFSTTRLGNVNGSGETESRIATGIVYEANAKTKIWAEYIHISNSVLLPGCKYTLSTGLIRRLSDNVAMYMQAEVAGNLEKSFGLGFNIDLTQNMVAQIGIRATDPNHGKSVVSIEMALAWYWGLDKAYQARHMGLLERNWAFEPISFRFMKQEDAPKGAPLPPPTQGK